MIKEKYIDRIDLHTYTQYSDDVCFSVIKVEELLKTNKTGIVSTVDYISFPYIYKMRQKLGLKDIKIIYGYEFCICFGKKQYQSTALLKNKKGLQNLYKIITILKKNNNQIKMEELENLREGLIFGLLDCSDTDILDKYYDYVEISQYNSKEEVLKIIDDCKKYNKIVIATSYPEMIDKEQEAALQFLYDYKGQRVFYDESRYYWTKEEMINYFSYLEDIEQIVIDNPKKIAARLEDIEIDNDEIYTYSFGNKNEFKNYVLEEANRLYSNNIPKVINNILIKELDYIEKHDLEGTITLIDKVIKEARQKIDYVILKGDLENSLVAKILDLTKKKDNEYCINSFNGKTHQNCIEVEYPYEEDVYSSFKRLVGEDCLCYNASHNFFGFSSDYIKKFYESTDDEINKIAEDIRGVYFNSDEWPLYELILIPKGFDIYKVTPLIHYEDADLPCACFEIDKHFNTISFEGISKELIK